MCAAEAPSLYDPLARDEFDLAALHPSSEDREEIAFAICDFGRHLYCGTEQAAGGEQLEDPLRRCAYERILMD